MIRRAILAIVLAAGIAAPLAAQTRVLVGADAGIDFSNESVGAVLGIEQPIGKHFEAELYERPSPIESHLGLGSGFANVAQAGGIAWLNSTLGISGTLEQSRYNVTAASKSAYYLLIGPIMRFSLVGTPSRLSVTYAGQLHNGVSSSGTESSHLNGFALSLDSRVSCARIACLRLKESFDVGHILEQGNPANDSPSAAIASGQTYHPRIGAFSGGFTFSAVLEFGRHVSRTIF